MKKLSHFNQEKNTGEALLWIIDFILARSNPLNLKRLMMDCFLQTCIFALQDMNRWTGLLVDYCDVFISCLDSHSDGTHSLQRIKSYRCVSTVVFIFQGNCYFRHNTHVACSLCRLQLVTLKCLLSPAKTLVYCWGMLSKHGQRQKHRPLLRQSRS